VMRLGWRKQACAIFECSIYQLNSDPMRHKSDSKPRRGAFGAGSENHAALGRTTAPGSKQRVISAAATKISS
jgi:hypothetical protein